MNNKPFDILDYLNDLYMAKMAPQINVQKAGGHYNIHDHDNNKAKEEIQEINKKRIDIPNAEIRYFSYQQQGDFEEHNEPETTPSPKHQSRKNGKRDHEIFDEGEQERGTSGGVAGEEVIEI